MTNEIKLHELRCETCKNKQEIRTSHKGTRAFEGEPTLMLGYKCKLTGLWCDEKYDHTKQISVVGCASHSDQQEHDQKIREETMDKFRILHGEDAKRFHEYMQNDKKIDTPEGKKLIKEAHDWANKLERGRER